MCSILLQTRESEIPKSINVVLLIILIYGRNSCVTIQMKPFEKKFLVVPPEVYNSIINFWYYLYYVVQG